MTTIVTDVVDPGPPQAYDDTTPISTNAPSGLPAGVVRPLRQKIITLTYSATYLTGGIVLTTDQMGGLAALFARGSAGGGYMVVPTYHADGTLTVKLFWRAADAAVLAEVPNATAVATVKRLFIIGRPA